MADDGRAFAVSEEDRAELVRLVNNLLRTTDRLDAQLSTMASMLNEFSNPRSSAKSEAFKELEVTERQHTSGTFLSIFPKALTEIDHSLSQDENQPLTASATAPLHPPPLPKTTIVTDTSPKPQTSQFKNEILPSRNQIEQPGLSAVFPIPHAPPGTPTLITQQTESSSVFLISPTSSSFTALTFKKLPQPVQSWALVQFPDATKLGKETMDELQPHPSHSTLTQPSTHINSAITNLPISSKPDFPLNFLQPNIIRAQDNKSIPPLRDKNCWCALDSKKLLLGAEQITAWRHRLNEGTIFLASLCGRVSLVECVAFDSTEVLVFAGATSGAIKLWDLQEFYPFGEFFVSGFAHKDHGFGVNSIKFIPNGCWVVSGGLDNVGGLDNDNVVSSLLRKFAFNDLKLATRSFRPESLLGEGGFGCVFKGWIEENGTAPARPGTGLTVAVKTLNHDGLQGHKNVASRFVVSFRAYWYQICCKQHRHEEVLRDGKWYEEDAAVLVPGDVISVKLGDIIPADGVYSGSTCKQGEIEAVVVATGVYTFFGKAAHLVDSTNQVGHFQKVLTAIGNFCICSIAVGMIIEIIVMYPIQQRAYRPGIDNLLVLLIGGIPIAMPTVLSVTMGPGENIACAGS